MKYLIIGSGGRESSICWKLSKSKEVEEIYIAPKIGHLYPKCKNTGINEMDFEKLIDFAKENFIDITIVGPEAPLVGGIVDAFEDAGLKIFGPRKREAILEGSKKFAKEFMEKYNIPTAKYKSFTKSYEAISSIEGFGYPLVVKADGLCAGKGVLICEDSHQAEKAIEDILEKNIFGKEGSEIVIEEFLEGIEASLLSFVSHNKIFPMESAKDFKRIGEGDTGLNTGGVACMSPSPLFNPTLLEKINKDIIIPIEEGLKSEGMDFTGILFIGLMIDGDNPKVLEFNVRFGDPETEVVLPRLKTDLSQLFIKTLDGSVDKKDFEWSVDETLAVILTSEGYPKKYEKGFLISGLDIDDEDIIIFHNGTEKRDKDYYTNGGRVLTVVGKGGSHKEAGEKVYQAIKQINFNNMQYRKDILNYV